MTTKERILTFLKEMKKKQGDFFAQIDMTASNFKGSAKKSELGADKIAKILSIYPIISPDWLLLGVGNMLRLPSDDKTNVYNSGSISGNVGAGNHMVNITMPESGTQKIIKPSGEVEIQRTDSTKSEDTKEAELCKEIELMKQRVALMEDTIKMKDDLIASLKDANAVLKDSIELLRNRQ